MKEKNNGGLERGGDIIYMVIHCLTYLTTCICFSQICLINTVLINTEEYSIILDDIKNFLQRHKIGSCVLI